MTIKKRVVKSIAPMELIQSKIYRIRNQNVMFDRDLAELYGVNTSQLKRQVRRNIKRFPKDFMFELTKEEYNDLRCQIGILNRGQHSKYLPFAFTEQGVAMLSSVLHSEHAIMVNIQIMRVFTKIRKMIVTYKDLKNKIESLERKYDKHEEKIQTISEFIKQMMALPDRPRRQIGFKTTDNKKGN